MDVKVNEYSATVVKNNWWFISKHAVVIHVFNQQVFMLDLLSTKHFSKFCWNNEEQDLVSDLNLNDAQIIYIYIYILSIDILLELNQCALSL